MQPQDNQDRERAAIAAAFAVSPSPTSAPPVFASMTEWAAWNFHTLAGEAVCDVGEWAMKRERQRGERARAAWHSWPAFCTRFYARETWRGIPGPWPVKAGLFVLAAAEPGPFGEMALAAFGKWNGRRMARKATTQRGTATAPVAGEARA